jgi:hypothetical protein
MAVGYTSDVDKQDVASGNDVFTSFAVSGTNPAIIIAAAMRADTGSLSVASIVLSAGLSGGTPVLTKTQTNGTTRAEIWSIPAPSGTGTITVTYTGSGEHQCCAVLMNNCDQTTPCPSADAAATTGSTSPLSITPANLTANDAVVYMACQSVSGDSPHVGTNEIFFGNSTNVNASVGYRLGTGSVSATWSLTYTTEVLVGVRVQAPTGGGGSVLGSYYYEKVAGMLR